MKLPTWRGKLPQWNGKKPSKDAWKASLRTRSFRVGGYSVAAAAIVVVIAVVANLLVNALPAGATQFDISAGSMFTMSQETEQLLDGLDQDITVYWLVQSGQEDETLGTLLDRYTSRSDRVTLEKRDPDVDPNFVQEYVTGTVYNNSLIVESEARYTYVSYEDIYTYEYGDDGASYYMNFAGESALTSAIDYVIRDTLPKLYTLTGHGESALSASFQSAVEKQNMELEELSLLTAEEVPEDADCLLICGPESDLTQEEKEAILAYLQEGGYYILMALAQGLKLEESPREGLSVSPLLTTSDEAYSKLAGYGMETYQKEEGDEAGPFALAAAATETLADGTESHVIWIASTSLLNDQYNQQVSGANQDFFLNCMGWTCEKEEGISIHAKTMTTEYLTMSASTASLLTLLVVAVLPAGYLAFGLRIWIRRKRQ